VGVTLTVFEHDLEEVALSWYAQMVDVEWRCPSCGHVQSARQAVGRTASLDIDVLRSPAASRCENPGAATIEPCAYSADSNYYSPPLLVVRGDMHFRCLPLAEEKLMAELNERGTTSERGIRIVHSDLL
jgi:hypothetical protein